MTLGPIGLYKGLGFEYTTLPIFFSILLILALLTSGVLFRSYFGPNTIVLLTKDIGVYLAIPK